MNGSPAVPRKSNGHLAGHLCKCGYPTAQRNVRLHSPKRRKAS